MLTVEEADESKQKAIRNTEEYVRREEAERREYELTKVNEEWKIEKKKIFLEAHQSQLKAIARETTIVEEKLREEFREKITLIEDKNKDHLMRMIESVEEEAEKTKNQMVLEARCDEQHQAQETARKVEEKVAQEKKEDRMKAEIEKAKAVEDLTQHMDALCEEALERQRRSMEDCFAAKMKELSDTHESRLGELKRELMGEIDELKCALNDMTISRSTTEQKYQDLKVEFSDFIDQVPGFKGDFLLK